MVYGEDEDVLRRNHRGCPQGPPGGIVEGRVCLNCIVMCRRLLRSVGKDYFYYPSHYKFGTFVATDDDDENIPSRSTMAGR